jgi:GAF domain-containing protein
MDLVVLDGEPQNAVGDGDVYRVAIRAFGDVAAALAAEADLDEILHLVASKLCDLFEIKRCSVYLKDTETGLFNGRVHSHPRHDEAIQRTVAGVVADRFTLEILETRRPVLVRDAFHDPRPIRSTMRAWNIRTMLGVPMIASDEVIGISYLDNEALPHPFTSFHCELASVFANLAATAIVQAQLQEKRRADAETVARQNALLRREREVDEQLNDLVLEGANLDRIAAVVSGLTQLPCAIYDARRRQLALIAAVDGRAVRTILDVPRSDRPQVVVAQRHLSDRQPAIIPPLPDEGLDHRALVAPVLAGADHWGHLVLLERGRRFGDFDRLVAARAATIVAVAMAAARRAAAARGEAVDALAADLLLGHRTTTLDQRAELLGARIDGSHFVVLVGTARVGEPACDTDTVRRAFTAVDGSLEVLTTSVDEGTVVITRAPSGRGDDFSASRVRELTAKVSEHVAGRGLVFAVSKLCRSKEEIPNAFRTVRHALEVIQRYTAPDETTVVTVDDIGEGALLLAFADRHEVDDCINLHLGRLLDPGDPNATDLLVTVRELLVNSLNVRKTAHRLFVHENTVRYRLRRFKELTGYDVLNDVNHQFAAHLMLTVLRLERRLPAPL